MTSRLSRIILYSSSLVGSYISIVLFSIWGLERAVLIPTTFIFVLSLTIIFSLCWVYYSIGWGNGIAIIVTVWLPILFFGIFFIQIPLLTPGSLSLSSLPYTNIRTVNEAGFIERDEIVSSSSPEVSRIERRSNLYPEDRRDAYIERYFLSWRYGVLLDKMQSLGDEYTTYNLYPNGFLENLLYSFRTISETVFRYFLFTSIPSYVLIYYGDSKSGDERLANDKIERFTNSLRLQVVIYTVTMGLILSGGLSILLSSP